MRLLYTLFIQIYTLLIAIFALVNPKAKLWIKGRKNWEKKLQAINFDLHQVYWFHCASLGEFEQGRPLIEQIKANGNFKILLTFFSPSGYELKKNYRMADWVFYLPADTNANAAFFIEKVKPKAVFFIKYEFWFNFLYKLKQRDIPVFLVSGIFREKQHFFQWYGSWASKQLSAFTYFFCQNQESLALLKRLGYNNAIVTGDTRFDRVCQIMQQNKKFEAIDMFVKDSLVLVSGSTYLEDERLLKSFYENANREAVKVKLIIAPHVVSSHSIKEVETLFGNNNCIRYSILDSNQTSKNVLIIDNIGMLSALYGYADIAYIGGGFGKGIHNTLEAAVYGIPLFFGHNFQKFEEAKALVNIGAAYVVNNENEFKSKMLSLLSNNDERKSIGLKSSQYVNEHRGALEKIMNELKKINLVV